MTMMSRWRGWVWGWMSIAGCTLPKAVGDVDETGSGSASVGTVSTGEASGTDSAGGVCPQIPDFACSAPVSCEPESCEGPFYAFDGEGCPRPSCAGPEDCGADEVCFRPADFGGCQASAVVCADDPQGECICGGTADCGGRYCVPASEAPPADGCDPITDSDTCYASNCSAFATVTRLTEGCACQTSVPACLLFRTANFGGAAAPNAFFHVETGDVAIFDMDWIDAPVGWQRCSDPDAPPTCDCWQPGEEPPC